MRAHWFGLTVLGLALVLLSVGCRRSTVIYRPPPPASGHSGTLAGLDVLEGSSFELLQGKTVGLVVNHASVNRKGRHAIDLLQEKEGIRVGAIFTPEHGLSGKAAAGEAVENGRRDDVPIISLYGKNRKPLPSDLEGLDILVFDLQDVGARFYTYVSTLTLVMQAAAEQGLPLVVLDRPNPLNGADVEGPLLQDGFQSFVGMHPVPMRHGMTMGELAFMINESGWLGEGLVAKLTVVALARWKREMAFPETGLDWVPPSPNLPDFEAAIAYPGTCLLEGTNVSEGRGTDSPFLLIGAPWIDGKRLSSVLENLPDFGFDFEPASFTPISMAGAKRPKYENQLCQGVRIVPKIVGSIHPVHLGVRLLDLLNRLYPDRFEFQENRHIDRLFGSDRLRITIEEGGDIHRLIDAWVPDLEKFKAAREGFLIY